MQNKTLFQFFEWYYNDEEPLWNKVARLSKDIAAMGFTAIWLPPAYKGTKGNTSEGYDVYDIYDLGEFNQHNTVATKYGTKEAYIQAIAAAHDAGLAVYADIVLNHMGGADETETITVRKVKEENRLAFTSGPMQIEAYTKFTFPGRAGKYSSFVWDHHCFTGVDHAKGSNETAIYSIVNEYGEGWEPLVHDEKGNFDYLMLADIEFRNPYVRDELKRWIKWYYATAQFDALRLDAVKHINPAFFIEWLDHIRAEIKPGMPVIGEYWLSDDLPVLLKYLDAVGYRMQLFDAPLHHNFSQASEGDDYDLRTVFNDTLVAVQPGSAVTFVDNHDTQPLQSLEEATQEWFKPHAYSLILLREGGYPCVFYPDIFGTSYKGCNKNNEACTIVLNAVKALPALLQCRKQYAYGVQTDYFDTAGCIGWVRSGIEEIKDSGCAVLLSNSGAATKTMFVGKQHAHKTFHNILNTAETIIIDDNGNGLFTVAEKSISVWVLQ